MTVYRVIAITTVQRVTVVVVENIAPIAGALPATDNVVARAAKHNIVAVATINRVIAIATINVVVALHISPITITQYGVITRTAIELVRIRTAI